ncbi:RNA polymerase sigma factor [Saccharobesus litoralis]|uniref:RNA polymerase sigma factor n=1 Tax=Saccharobesus litoralis TaxID=2172099 RepID=UPI00131F1E91|nr:sigma-70 family RNA polymerase sigma factor [Saccharobesus litoralis]
MQQAKIDLLVISAQRGNQAAFSELVNEFNQPLLRFGYRLCSDTELVKDAVQETWLTSAKGLSKLNDPRAFRCWLYQTLRWRLTDLARKQSQFELVELAEHKDVSEGGVPEQPAVTKPIELDNEVLKAIAQLGETEQQILHLFYLDEMKMVEIAAILSIPVGTVKSRLNRAKKQLKTIMQA